MNLPVQLPCKGKKKVQHTGMDQTPEKPSVSALAQRLLGSSEWQRNRDAEEAEKRRNGKHGRAPAILSMG